MGEITVFAFAGLALLGLVLVAFGSLRRSRIPLLAGCAMLAALIGAWVIGLPGIALGVLPLLFLTRGPGNA